MERVMPHPANALPSGTKDGDPAAPTQGRPEEAGGPRELY
jgi:hypothetical protein